MRPQASMTGFVMLTLPVLPKAVVRALVELTGVMAVVGHLENILRSLAAPPR